MWTILDSEDPRTYPEFGKDVWIAYLFGDTVEIGYRCGDTLMKGQSERYPFVYAWCEMNKPEHPKNETHTF